jgi:hypothetical protein
MCEGFFVNTNKITKENLGLCGAFHIKKIIVLCLFKNSASKDSSCHLPVRGEGGMRVMHNSHAFSHDYSACIFLMTKPPLSTSSMPTSCWQNFSPVAINLPFFVVIIH